MGLNTIEFERLQLNKGDVILDVGCGVGRHTLMAYRDLPVKAIGIDLGFDDLNTANSRISDLEKKSCKGEVLFAQANAYKLPFDDNSFDAVMCSEVLEHVPDYQTLLEELIRVLKPKGRLALSVPKYLPEKLCWLLSKDYPEYAGHVRIFKGAELPEAVKERGLALVEQHSAHALHSPYWWLRSAFFKQGDQFTPVRYYKKVMDWQLMKGPIWTSNLEALFNPYWGKSNVYYFEKA